MSGQEIVHAYRDLLRGLLRAVQYSSPARYTARDQLRAAFREPNAVFDRQGVKRTIWFLKAAEKYAGLEHRILRNLLKTAWRREVDAKPPSWKTQLTQHPPRDRARNEKFKAAAFRHYDMTVAMLNRTMGLCLR